MVWKWQTCQDQEDQGLVSAIALFSVSSCMLLIAPWTDSRVQTIFIFPGIVHSSGMCFRFSVYIISMPLFIARSLAHRLPWNILYRRAQHLADDVLLITFCASLFVITRSSRDRSTIRGSIGNERRTNWLCSVFYPFDSWTIQKFNNSPLPERWTASRSLLRGQDIHLTIDA